MTAIDVHAHIFPSSILTQVGDPNAALGVSYSADDRVLTFPSGPSRPLFEGLTDLEKRRAWNNVAGITRQVLSPWMDVAGDDLTGDAAVAWTGLYNDGVAAEIDGDDMFLAFATLPIDDGVAAAAELERAVKELGFVGGALPTQVRGVNLSDAGLDPLFEAAEEMGVPLFLHPYRVLGADRLGFDFMTNICGNPFETTVAAMSLFFSGATERYPDLKVLLSHCGGTLPLIAGRAAHGSRTPQVGREVGAPEEILESFFYDTLLHDPRALGYAIARVGIGRVALGSDVPFPMAVDDPRGHVLRSLEPVGLASGYEQVTVGTPTTLLGEGLALGR